jgi:hypothetical protein
MTTTMRATIAVPPVHDFYFTWHRFSSLGAVVLSNLLSENGVAASLFNFPMAEKHGTMLEIPGEISFLQRFILPQETGKLSYFTNYKRYGPSVEECASAILATSPDLCFISCYAFSYALESLDLARQVKMRAPHLPSIIGGAGPSAYPLYFIQDPSIDFVLTGEAETSIKSFLETFLSGTSNFEGVPNCYWKKDGRPQTPSHTTSTDPKSISVAISKVHETRTSVFFSSSLSRGCPKRCAFCSNFLTHGPSFRVAEISRVRHALAALPPESLSSTKNRFVNFEDDNLLFDEDYCFEVMRLFKKTFGQASFLFENGIDYTLLYPELVNRLAAQGLAKFNLSIVTAHREVAQRENRIVDIDHYEKMVRSIASLRLPSITYFICGFKNDSKSSIAETLAFLHGQPTLIGISLFYAVPGISGFEDVSFFEKLPPFLCNGSSAFPWNNSLSTKTLITAFRLSRYCNLVKQGNKSAIEIEALRKIHDTKTLFTFARNKRETQIVPVENYDEELTEMFFLKIKDY